VADILDEVLNDQRDEKKLYYFRKTLPLVIFFTVVAVILMLIYGWYKDKQVKHNMKMGAILVKAIAAVPDDKDLALKSLKSVVEKSNNRVGELALLEEVGIKITDKDYIGAKALLEKIINNKNYSSTTTSYACLVWLSLVIDEQNISDKERKQFQEYLQHFTNENQEFFGTAGIIKAIWYIRNNQLELAKDTLTVILSLTNISHVIKDQARALMSSL
jgi:hypothetical protein